MEERERERVGREEWAKRVERWSDSGLSAVEFAAELGINPRTLSYWKWVLKRESSAPRQKRSKRGPRVERIDGEATGERGSLIEIQPRRSEASFELELEGGRKLRVPAGFDADGLRKLLSVLEAR